MQWLAILAWRKRDRRRIVGNPWVDKRPDGVTLEELLGYQQRCRKVEAAKPDAGGGEDDPLS